jgi:hypothetical protein
MVNDQIVATLELLQRLETNLNDDINSQLFTGLNKETQDARVLLKRRRQSAGHLSLNLVQQQLQSLDQDESENKDKPEQMSRLDQINNIPNPFLFKRHSGRDIDQSNMTEIEYIKYL